MSDLQRLCSMLETAGTIHNSLPRGEAGFYENFGKQEVATQGVLVKNSTGLGLPELESVWLFNDDGNLVGVGHYER